MKDWPQGLNSWANPATAARLTVHSAISVMMLGVQPFLTGV